MSRAPAHHTNIMFCLSPALAKAFRAVAVERKQTNSAVAEEFLQEGVDRHKAAQKTTRTK